MANEDASSKLVFPGIRGRAAIWQAKMIVLAEKEDVEVTTTLREIAEELLHSKDGMKQLKPVYRCQGLCVRKGQGLGNVLL
jgi:hypothetical protein